MTSHGTIQLVIGFLGVIALVLVAGAIFLTFQEKDVPDALWTLAGGGVGAFSSLLARTSSGDDPQPVVVEQGADNPVPVEEK